MNYTTRFKLSQFAFLLSSCTYCPQKSGISKCQDVCLIVHQIQNLEYSFLIHLEIEIHYYVRSKYNIYFLSLILCAQTCVFDSCVHLRARIFMVNYYLMSSSLRFYKDPNFGCEDVGKIKLCCTCLSVYVLFDTLV